MKHNVVLIIILFKYSIFPSILRVPGEYTTIQLALDSASSSDTILVASGIYKENLIWPMTSGLRLLSDKGPEQTIIEAGDSGSVCGINTGVQNTFVRGFTFSKGTATGT